MDWAPVRRRTVALIAAYAIALQALLSGLVAPVPVTAPFAVLCTHDSSAGAGQPVQHELPCAAICAALGHGIAGPLPPAIAVTMAAPTIIALAAPVIDWIAPRPVGRTPHIPRGPPLA
jgi:hypothetical protein